MQTHRKYGGRQGPLGLPALFAAMIAGLGFGFARRPVIRLGQDAPRPGDLQATPSALPAAVAPALAAEAVQAPAPLAAFPVLHPVEAIAPVEALVSFEPVDAGVRETRPVPTGLGLRVLAALRDADPVRKVQVARLVGIGRGAANRIVDRLVAGGWLTEESEGYYRIA